MTIVEWCLNWTRLSSGAIVFTQNLIQWFINNQSLCHIWDNCLISCIATHTTMRDRVVLSSCRAWYTLFSIKVEVWSWIRALDTFRSIIKWSGAVAWLISLWKLIKGILLDCERMLSYPVRSENIRYISVLACVISFIVGYAGDTISTVEVEYSESWVIGWRASYALLMNCTVKGCWLWAKIFRLCCCHIANILFLLGWCCVRRDTSF